MIPAIGSAEKNQYQFIMFRNSFRKMWAIGAAHVGRWREADYSSEQLRLSRQVFRKMKIVYKKSMLPNW